MGADKIGDALPPLLRAVRLTGHPVVWICDPMHGNTFQHASGYKTRDFDDVMRELHGFFAACDGADVWPGGVHVELTGENVTECLGGSHEVLGDQLEQRYETSCDPRLNARQSLDLAFQVAELLRAVTDDQFEDLGSNSGLVEDLYQRYLENPASVDDHWRAYFAGEAPPPNGAQARLRLPACTAHRRPLPAHPPPGCASPAPLLLDGDEPEPLRGGAARTVENMEASLGVPTATSVRAVPAKLLEVNRQILNNHLARDRRGQGRASRTSSPSPWSVRSTTSRT